MLIIFRKDNICKLGNVEDDKGFLIISPSDERVVGGVREDLVEIVNEGWGFFAFVVF